MSKFATAIKALVVGSTVAFTTLSGAYTPLPDQIWEPPTDDCPRVVRSKPGVWPHFPCTFPKPCWDVIR